MLWTKSSIDILDKILFLFLTDNAESINLDITAKSTSMEKTGFEWALFCGDNKVADLIRRKLPINKYYKSVWP